VKEGFFSICVKRTRQLITWSSHYPVMDVSGFVRLFLILTKNRF